jgi:hypothetical protein
MAELIAHERVQIEIDRYLSAPTHALIINGAPGIGKASLAQLLANTLVTQASYRHYITPVDGKAIPIEAIRKLEHFLALKVPGTSTTDRAIVIENADTMTGEAQNALLKNLEEPPAGTIMLLTASNRQALLPTIRSRAQQLAVIPPSKRQLMGYFGGQGDHSQAIERAYTMTGGLPGLMTALLKDEDHPLVAAVVTARQLLQGSPYERLLEVDSLAKQPALVSDTLFILRQMADVSLSNATGLASKRWQQVLQASYSAAESLQAKGQPRLVLTNLMLNLA